MPFHLLDKNINDLVNKEGYYPTALIEDLYSVSFHLIRNFELAPYANDSKIEDIISKRINEDKL